jgi:phage tail sheath gpL-like
MPVSALNFPSNWNLPLYWVEVDPSQAGLPVFRDPALIIGQLGTGGTWTANVPVAAASIDAVRAGAGAGSMLDEQAQAFLANNRAQELWFLPVANPGGGVAATHTLTITAGPTVGGTYALYINDRRIQVGVSAGNSVTAVAAKIVAAINADPTLPVTAANAAGVVTLTSKIVGTLGNDMHVADSLLGLNGGESMPIGMAVTYSGGGLFAGGTGVVDLSAAITALGDFGYEYFVSPFVDSGNLTLLETELGFGDTGRWGWMRQLYGLGFSARRDTYSSQLTYGATRNAGIMSVMDVETAVPSAIWKIGAAYAAKAARSLSIDPARPLQTLDFDGVMPAPVQSRRIKAERNALANAGLAVQTVNSSNKIMIEVEATEYQKNAYGVPDDAYKYLTTLATLARLFRNQRQEITSRFPRHKLADDGTPFGTGQAIATPSMVKGHLIGQYRIDMFNGLVENLRAFKQNLIVERDTNNPSRLNVLYPPDLINGLRIFYTLAQFRLQYDRGVDLTIAA